VADSAIVVEKINKSFGSHQAVKDLSLVVNQGEIYGFLGPNGSGKSTTLRMILSLLKPDSGSITIQGHNLSTQRQKALSNIGCIIEKPDFYNYMTAADNLKLFARMHNVSTADSFINGQLEFVGLKGRENDKVKTYSHGMKQRLGLAQALLHQPQIIILDEPNTGLDPQGIIELRQLLLKLNQEQGKTILLSSHILNEIEEIAHSMILINKGQTIAQGKVQELLNKEQVIVGIETDDAQALMTTLQQSQFAHEDIHIENNQVHVQIEHSKIPHLHLFLAEQKIPIYNLEKTRSLERLFLKLTHA
jgi:ABC-type multidrug transport system ATPase subunit